MSEYWSMAQFTSASERIVFPFHGQAQTTAGPFANNTTQKAKTIHEIPYH